jgi:cobalamin-dependent methionine synthase I
MLIAADNITTSRPSLRRLIEQRDQAGLSELCRECQAAGAAWLDLNPGWLSENSRDEVWRFLISTAEAATNLTLLIDAPRPAEMAEALGHCTRPPVLNMATAQPERLGPVLRLAAGQGLKVVAATMTATVPESAAERLSLAGEIVAEADRLGLAREDLYLDPMVMPLALPGGEAHAAAVIEVLRSLPQIFDPAPASLVALSNLTTSTAAGNARAAAGPFLAAAWGAGLKVAMMDCTEAELSKLARLLGVFEGRRVFAPAEFASDLDNL